MPDYIPTTDAGLLAWSANFSTLITATPVDYGLTAAIATTLAGKQSAYATALEAATNPATRGGATVLAKDSARVDLVAYCRQLARAIQGTLTVTDAQRFDLGLTVRDVDPTPVPPPAGAPALLVLSSVVRTVRVRMVDPANPTRRGKPAGVAGASIFSFVGEEPPAEIAGWTFEGNASRTSFEVEFPAAVAGGATVWVAARWFNARLQQGPISPPVSTNLPGGSAMAA